jgi:hypothetical protein
MAAGVLTGGLAGTVSEGGEPVPVSAQAAGLDLTGEFPFGVLAVVVGQESRPVLDLQAGLGAGRVTVGGKVRIGARDWQRIGRRTGWLPGLGQMTAQIDAGAPWGAAGSSSAANWLPDPGSFTGHATVTALAWTLDGAIADLERATGRLRFSGTSLEGEIKGRARLHWAASAPIATAPAAIAPSAATPAAALLADDGSDAVASGVLPVEVRFRTADVLADLLRIDVTWQSGPLGPLEGSLRYSAATRAIELQVAGDQVIAQPLMAGIFEAWPAPWDLDAGRLSLAADLTWPASGDLDGRLALTLADASAHYADYRVAGLGGEFVVALSGTDWQLAPTDLRAARLNAGIELTDVTARVGVDAARVGASAAAIGFERAGASVFGGTLATGPFTFDPVAGTAALEITLTAIDLGQVLALYGDRIMATGLLDGTLPAMLAEGTVTVSAGRLVARAPGGVIRVAPELSQVTGQPGLDFALRALGDFTYTALGFAENGDLKLAVALRGRNPEVEEGRPIHYNLNVTENIPQLLEALTVDRELIEAIERRVRR